MIQRVKLFTSNDLVKPDILGIKLTVAVGWNASQTYLIQLVKGFRGRARSSTITPTATR